MNKMKNKEKYSRCLFDLFDFNQLTLTFICITTYDLKKAKILKDLKLAGSKMMCNPFLVVDLQVYHKNC